LRYSAPLLELCEQALAEVTAFERPADAVLSAFFRVHREAGQQDRAQIAETVYAAVRRWCLLQFLAPKASFRQLVLATWAGVMGANLKELDGLLRRGDRDWLAALKGAMRSELPFEVQCDLPDWVIAALRERFDDPTLLLHARSLQQPAPLDLRVNLLKRSREEVLERLAADGLQPRVTPYSPAGIRLAGKPSVNRHPMFLAGEIEVQDEGSQLLAWLVEPRRGEMVVDF
jgi:16S rRNA (cytosine967-C5)-methyltransferase